MIRGRDQLDANLLLEALEARAADGRLLVGVASQDIAIPVFTFVFGLARQGGRACVVSLARADPSFYGLPAGLVPPRRARGRGDPPRARPPGLRSSTAPTAAA